MDLTSSGRVEIQLSAKVAEPGPQAGATPSAKPAARNYEGWNELLAKATCEVFEVMVGITLRRVAKPGPRVVADYTAMVGLAGGLCGVLSVRGPSEAARRMAANMLGVDDVTTAASILDAFGEVCNMVAGSFKSRVPGLAESCSLSVPAVISGKDYSLHSLADGERFEVVFTFENRPISVSLDLQS